MLLNWKVFEIQKYDNESKGLVGCRKFEIEDISGLLIRLPSQLCLQ